MLGVAAVVLTLAVVAAALWMAGQYTRERHALEAEAMPELTVRMPVGDASKLPMSGTVGVQPGYGRLMLYTSRDDEALDVFAVADDDISVRFVKGLRAQDPPRDHHRRAGPPHTHP